MSKTKTKNRAQTKNRRRADYVKDLAELQVGDQVRVWRHERVGERTEVVKGGVVTVAEVARLSGAVEVRDVFGDVIGTTLSSRLKLERV